jgi:hypothetical protein
MLPQEIILNIGFSILASIAFFYTYKKSQLMAMLIAGMMTYFELLIRLFMANTIMIQGINLLLIPEIFIIIYMIWFTYQDGFKWIPLMLIGLLVSFSMLISIGHQFYGDLGVMFGLIMIIWVNQSTHPCSINPWACTKNGRHKCKVRLDER